jgi:signal transduction histidine kinase
MEGIIRQLLQLGRDEVGRRRPVELDPLVRGAVEAVAEEARRSGVRLDLRPPTRPVPVDVDPRRIEEAIRYLLRNALQAAPGGQVRISWERSLAHVILTVDDDGPGVPDDVRARVFEPFYTTKPHGEGAGLGLAVVQGVVEDHNGRIVVDGSPLGGARFSVTLPTPDGQGREVAKQ